MFLGGDIWMGKAPAFQFYVRDWLSDPQLRQASPGTRGIWIDILCFMWESVNRGKIEGTQEQLMRMTGASKQDFDQFLNEAEMLKFCDMSRNGHGIVTLENRRMKRDEKERENWRLRKVKERSKKDVTQTSRKRHGVSSSSTSNNNIHFDKFWDKYPLKKGKQQALKIWAKLSKSKNLPEIDILLSAIDNQIQEKKYLKDHNKFCPEWKHPSTWLNGGCWDDDVKISDTNLKWVAP